jgi:hypothetical protein
VPTFSLFENVALQGLPTEKKLGKVHISPFPSWEPETAMGSIHRQRYEGSFPDMNRMANRIGGDFFDGPRKAEIQGAVE